MTLRRFDASRGWGPRLFKVLGPCSLLLSSSCFLDRVGKPLSGSDATRDSGSIPKEGDDTETFAPDSRSGSLSSGDESDRGLAIVGGTSDEESCRATFSAGIAFLTFEPTDRNVDSAVTCTGSVLNESTILTAAHCGGLKTFSGQGRFTVRCGCDESVGLSRSFQAIIDPDDPSYALDAAIVEFESLPETCQPLALAEHEKIEKAGQSVLVAGFGLQPGGSFGKLSIGETILSDKLEDIESGHGLGPRKRMVALLEKEGGIRTCFGDSGAPYLAETDLGVVQIGLHVAVLPFTKKACPDEARMIGHEMAPIMKWLRASRVPFYQYQVSGDVVRVAPQEKSHCFLKFWSDDHQSRAEWVVGENLYQAACHAQCLLLAPTQLALHAKAECHWKGKILASLEATSLGIAGACERVERAASHLWLRFNSASEPCSVRVEVGSCAGAAVSDRQAFPKFQNSSPGHLACEGHAPEPKVQLGCALVRSSLTGETSWSFFDDALESESCRLACAEARDLAEQGQDWCSFRGAVL